jgi:signal recognition particle subunit SRP54
MEGEFDLEDFLNQMQQIKKLGPIGKLMEMIPGMNQAMKDVDMSNAEQDMKRIEAIIQSMTPYERRNPKALKASRKRRVAAGSGTSVQDINGLLRQFREMQTMMKQMRKGRGKGLASLLGGKF